MRFKGDIRIQRYFRAVGFKSVSQRTFATVHSEALHQPSKRYFLPLGKELDYIEYYKNYGETFGVSIRGEMDENETITKERIIPYAMADAPVRIMLQSAQTDGNDCVVYCTDVNQETELTFYLQNLYEQKSHPLSPATRSAYLAGLSETGKILLPIQKQPPDDAPQNESAQKISLSAIFHKPIDDETGKTLWDKMKANDLLSIVHQYMIPHKDSLCVYSVLGQILRAALLRNQHSKEEVYRLQISVTGAVFDVYINSTDLVGLPTAGMRFMGTCFLQGFLIP